MTIRLDRAASVTDKPFGHVSGDSLDCHLFGWLLQVGEHGQLQATQATGYAMQSLATKHGVSNSLGRRWLKLQIAIAP